MLVLGRNIVLPLQNKYLIGYSLQGSNFDNLICATCLRSNATFCDFLAPGYVPNSRFFEMLLLRNRVIHYRLNSDSRRKIISLFSLFAVRLQCFGTALVHTRFQLPLFISHRGVQSVL